VIGVRLVDAADLLQALFPSMSRRVRDSSPAVVGDKRALPHGKG